MPTRSARRKPSVLNPAAYPGSSTALLGCALVRGEEGELLRYSAPLLQPRSLPALYRIKNCVGSSMSSSTVTVPPIK
jgi:hypothetical protein